jgi:glycosyltransferase involved in cell wall biosynthesis
MNHTLSTILVIGPTPPPLHGVAVSTQLILDSPVLAAFRRVHLDTSDRRSGRNIGAFEPGNVVLALWHALMCLILLGWRRPRLVYLPISQGAGGYLRDLAFILPCEALGVPVVVHLRGSEFRQFYTNAHPLLQALIRYSLARVARVIVLGETLRDIFDGLVPPERVAVVPNGTPDIHPGLAPADKPAGRVRGLYLSNLRRRKGVLVALAAAIQSLQRYPQLEFVFAGEWRFAHVRDEALALVAASGVGDRLHFVGAVDGDDKQRLLLSADFFVFPPIEPEGHPRVVLEAMAAGLPVITTPQGALIETVVEGCTGFFVEPGDASAIVAHIARLIEDPDRRIAMGRAARERYLSEYTAEVAHARLLRVFADVLDAPGDAAVPA